MSVFKKIKVKENESKSYIIQCHCGSQEHSASISWFPDDSEVYLSVNLSDNGSFWKRLKIGIKYIFGYKSRYGMFSEIVLFEEDIKNIIDICNQCHKDLRLQIK